MGQTDNWVWPHQTDRRLGMSRTNIKQLKSDRLQSHNSRGCGSNPWSGPYTNVGLAQTWSSVRFVWSRLKTGYGSDRRQNRPKKVMGQTDDRLWASMNRPNSGMDRTEFRYGTDGAPRPKICPDYELGLTRPTVRDPGPSGNYLSWVSVFILGVDATTYYSL